MKAKFDDYLKNMQMLPVTPPPAIDSPEESFNQDVLRINHFKFNEFRVESCRAPAKRRKLSSFAREKKEKNKKTRSARKLKTPITKAKSKFKGLKLKGKSRTKRTQSEALGFKSRR